jgi:hypothetical protein
VNEYRAYTVSSDGHFIGFEPLACADDAEAIARAGQLVNGYHSIEVWSGPRLVQRQGGERSRKTVSYQIKNGRMVPKDGQGRLGCGTDLRESEANMGKPTRGRFHRSMGGSALKRPRKRKFQLLGRSSSQRPENKTPQYQQRATTFLGLGFQRNGNDFLPLRDVIAIAIAGHARCPMRVRGDAHV